MRIKVIKNVELDMDAPINEDDEGFADSKKDLKTKIIICPCCGVLFDPKTDEVQIISFSRRYKRSNRTVYDGGSHTEKPTKGQETRRGD